MSPPGIIRNSQNVLAFAAFFALGKTGLASEIDHSRWHPPHPVPFHCDTRFNARFKAAPRPSEWSSGVWMARVRLMWRVGILIAGSLYWSTEPYRVTWRSKFLDMDGVIPVRAPIRYGRKSRHGSYTMVFAPGNPMGQAKVVASQRHATSIVDILSQAKALWLAERPADARPVPGQLHSASWGCVALLPQPNGNMPSRLLDEWARHVAEECGGPGRSKNYDPASYNIKGRAAIDERGLLQIPWPNCSTTGMPLDGFDVLLATATKPSPDPATGDFPTAVDIAIAWNARGDASYFHSNRKNEFHTFQDEEIAALLNV